jgi:hypothetical protein
LHRPAMERSLTMLSWNAPDSSCTQTRFKKTRPMPRWQLFVWQPRSSVLQHLAV